MEQFTEGDRVRVDIPRETDPDHEKYHGRHGTVVEILEDDAAQLTGDNQDAGLLRVELENGKTADFRQRDLRPPIEDV